jgi:antitoxin (DNA-binding transcriptional repressor) of toxin-antitoxin stability system
MQTNMQSVDVVEMTQNLESYIDQVVAGSSFMITSNGVNCAVMQPYHMTANGMNDRSTDAAAG